MPTGPEKVKIDTVCANYVKVECVTKDLENYSITCAYLRAGFETLLQDGPCEKNRSGRAETTKFPGNAQEGGIIEAIRKKRSLAAVSGEKYMDTQFILVMSSICERLVSKAGFSFNDRRQGMLPVSIDDQILL